MIAKNNYVLTVFDSCRWDSFVRARPKAIRNDNVPKNTCVTILSDHGELFDADGYFGHGPINHDKVYEVFFVEGKVR